MRRNATKVAAAVLTLAVTMTSVNIPTTAAAAKKVKLTPAKKTLTVFPTVSLDDKLPFLRRFDTHKNQTYFAYNASFELLF